MDIGAWLRQLGLEPYEQAFRGSEIEPEVLPELTDADLKELGLPLGPRRKLLRAIRALSEEHASDEASSPSETAARPEAERRHLTVMFVDLVGSTALSTRLDPEDMRQVIRAYQDVCAGAITRFEGHIAKYMGDGVLAYFGWPRAHEDDAERAVRAGLAITHAAAQLDSPAGASLAARVGIATGLVVVGDLIGEGAAREEAVVGDTPNLAARLQGLGESGQIVIADGTRRLLGDIFVLADLGSQSVKGIAKVVRAFAVKGERTIPSRFEARSGPSLLPMVGRDQELALLLERWAQAKGGEGQGVLLLGEAGIGKSRIGSALLHAVAEEPHVRVRYQCSPYHTDSALWPVIQQLTHAAGIEAADTAEAKLGKLEALLAQADGNPADATPLIADLIGLDHEARYGKLELTPQAQRACTLDALVRQLLGLAARQPVLVVLEDAQWVDPTTLELLEQWLDRIAAARVLLLLTSRPEHQPGLAAHPHVTRLTLNRLGRAGVEAIVTRLGGDRLAAETMDAIIARTDGVPLFVEELTKAVLETGETTVPASLHDSLMARLDRIPEVKEVAQTAACIGREFDFSLLAAVTGRSKTELLGALKKLAAAELAFRRGIPPEVTYSFKHALVQDVAYQSLLKSKRHKLHARIAEVLETRFPRVAESEPEVLARHFTNAGCADSALRYWLRAGRRAAESSASLEAVGHLTKGLEVLSALPDTADRARHELALRIALSGPLMATRGYGSTETIEAYERLRELCEELGEIEQLFPVLHGQWVHLIMQAKYREAVQLAEHMLRLAEGCTDPVPILMAHRMSGVTMTLLGRLAVGRKHLEVGVSLYDAERDHGLALRYVHDPKVAALSYLSTHTWLFGYPDQARQASREAIAWARELNHANSLAYALCFAGTLPAHLWRDISAVAEHTGELIALAEEQRFPLWLSWGRVPQGWLLARSGQRRAGIEMIRETLAELRRTDHEFYRPWFLYFLAEAHVDDSEFEKALSQIEEGRSVLGQTQERWCEAELQRLKGELLKRLPGSGPGAAEACFERAMEIARWQEAKSWELRAATSLARLWHDHGRRSQAYDILAPVYDWFTEGFDTPDLLEAKALLDELS